LVLLVCFCILFPCSLSIILGLLLQCVTLFYVYLIFFLQN
jgi:hypothetical protein